MRHRLSVKNNQIQLPCKVGDVYYRLYSLNASAYKYVYDKVDGMVLCEESKKIGFDLVKNKWSSYWEIVQAIENGRVGKTIFLTLDEAREECKRIRKMGWTVRERV